MGEKSKWARKFQLLRLFHCCQSDVYILESHISTVIIYDIRILLLFAFVQTILNIIMLLRYVICNYIWPMGSQNYKTMCSPFSIPGLINPLGWPTITASNDHCFHICRTSMTVPFFSKHNTFQVQTLFGTGKTVSPARGIIDDTCLVFYYFRRIEAEAVYAFSQATPTVQGNEFPSQVFIGVQAPIDNDQT